MKILSNPDVVVGKYYMVSVAIMAYGSGRILYIPIVGEKHADPAFAGPVPHWHIDGRFTHDRVDQNGKTNSIIWATSPEFKGIEQRRRMCKRLTTGIKPPPGAERYQIWANGMIGKSCKGRKCPHLGTIMHLIDGLLVCPLHNLIGCTKSETIVGPVFHDKEPENTGLLFADF